MLKFTDKRGVSRRGVKENTVTKELFERVRRVLKKTKEELPDRLISETIRYANKEIADWLINNPEGYELGKNKGYLVVSKHLPKEFRDDKEEKIKKIESLDVPEYVRKTYLKRYNIDIGARIDLTKAKELKTLIPQMNLHSFFYVYRFMWFNKRNTDFYKSMCYEFDANRELKKKLMYSILDGKDYYEWNFDDFHKHKVHPIESQPPKRLKKKLDKDGEL